MSKTYYFISDLHIGGDEALGVCDFEDELVASLETLSNRGEGAELVIVGDAFGLWEFTQVEGLEKLQTLIGQFPRIFEAFRRAGEKVEITLLPGNHDYEIACYPEFVDVLKAYNIKLERTPSITREIDGKRLWIEHGNQHDEANRMPDFGNPHAQPIGYFITSNMVGRAGQLSERGRRNWLKDIQSVYPTELVPDWVISNYFYREMSPVLRWMLLPFLLLFGLTIFVLAGAALYRLGVTETNVFVDNTILESLGIVGSLVQLVLIVNAVVLLLLIVLWIPLGFVIRDAKKTMTRFGVVLDPAELTGQKEDAYLNAARKVFDDDPDTVAFVYGHTHKPSVRRFGERAVINTGTWLKQFARVKPRFGLLPPIYVPRYRLSYFRIHADEGKIVIEYNKVAKDTPRELTWTQRVVVSRRDREQQEPVPERTVLEV